MIHPPFHSNRTNWGTDFIAPQSLGGVRRIFVGPTLLDWTLDMRRSASVSASSKQWSANAVMLESLEQMSSGGHGVLAPCWATAVPALSTSSRCEQQRQRASRLALSGRSARGSVSCGRVPCGHVPSSHVSCGQAPFSRALPMRRARQSIRRGALESKARHSGAEVVTLVDVELSRGFESNPRQSARRRGTLCRRRPCVRRLLRS